MSDLTGGWIVVPQRGYKQKNNMAAKPKPMPKPMPKPFPPTKGGGKGGKGAKGY